MTKPRYRRCWDCGAINLHSDNITPEVCCKRCQSQDTRLMKTGPPLWAINPRGIYIPKQIATCPECGEELMARSLEHEADTGRPVATGIEIDCLSAVRAGAHEVNHRWSQDKWQPVRDAVAKWCDARVDFPGK